MQPKTIIRIEGVAVLLISIYVYAAYEFNWLLFGLFLFAPDLSMVGYLKSKQTGAWVYNIFHTYALPIIIVMLGFIFVHTWFLKIALIWFAHIGMDRMFGFGLKYKTAFKDTHIQRV
ncbi:MULTISPECIES: DUF4260 domain-containing protein [Virgibacillus]|uniref:DUF4260 domain-containing protein n=1 Tax=Virgibacillus TaxID=84406 RepID=UPI000388858D|nr:MULTISPECIES: DUF4260 domain-containing protein [Virgibacillus]EQB34927.1 hypothetical protein M948_17615 [Virgibacillus sp. CM-4]MYL42952.1 DUF4260 family protein [Virgibacillus massiliensis]